MHASIRKTFVYGLIALAGVCNAESPHRTNVVHPLRILINTNSSHSYVNVSAGLIKIQGSVVSQSSTGTMHYSSWLRAEFLEHGEKKGYEECFRPHDESLRSIAPGKTNMFIGAMGGPPPLSDIQFYGKGVVFAYATMEGSNGITNRISNLITLNVDMENPGITIREDKP